MQLFYWPSQALEQYGLGHIIVMASDEETAKQKAVDEYKATLRPHWFDEDEVEEKLRLFHEDLDAPARTVSDVYLIQGSE